MPPSDISFFARTNARSSSQPFGLRQPDRLLHVYVIGKTGTGKSTLLETLARSDILAGRGCAVLDPHGDLVDRLMNAVPAGQRERIVFFDVTDLKEPYGYNPLRRVRPDKIPLAASGLMEALKKLWSEAWGVRMEHILRNALYTLLEYEGARLPDILRLISDASFRAMVVKSITNEQVKRFWLTEFPHYNPRYRQETIAPIQNKVGAFLADPRLYRIFTGGEELRFRRIMDEGRVLLVNLSRGELGEDSSNLLGSLLVTTLSLAAYSRGECPREERTPFFIYLDEFQLFTTLSTANMISEMRKFGIGLILAHQHLGQLAPEVRHAVLGNMGTLVTFRMGGEDAEFFAREFSPEFTAYDLLSLPNYDCYVRLMIGGSPTRPFSATTLNPDQNLLP